MDITEVTATEDLWTPYKELVAVVEGYLTREGSGPPYAVHTFEAVLRRHKQTFLSLLKNPPKNPTSRDEVRRGITEGVNLPSVGRTLLSKELVEEAIILSDMYEVNEYLSLELVHTAQRQMPRHPGLPRGLVAVLLYYDGRRALAQALKDLVMARDGVSWSIPARDEIIKYVTRYVDQLISDGLLGSSLDALRKFSLSVELELLQNNRALPPPNHHNRLVDTIESTRKLLAGVVFAASAQRGLSRDILLRLISEQTTSPTQGPTGSLDEISLALQMALLYALDLSVLHRREDGEELAKKLPLIQDVDLISVLLDELSPPANSNQAALDGTERASGGVRALCQLALGLALAALKRAPQSLLRSSGQEMRSELLDQDEALVDAAVDGKVFEYLDEVVLSSELVAKEEYYQRRLHTLLTDFIHLMHSKLTEMRIKADEAARAVQMYLSEGLSPPQGAGAPRTRLDALLRCVDKLYSRDPLGLRHDYWLACETHHDHSYRSGGRAATLYKFVRLAGSLATPALLPGYLRALAALCVPRHTWALLATAPLSAHHLLHALAQYKHNLRVEAPFSEHAHASMGASGVVTAAARPGRLLVRREEVDAMVAALRLIAAVARQDAAAAAAICDNLQWDAVNVMFGLICCHIPLHLKAELCITLAALGGTAATAGRVWAGMEAAQLVSVTKDIRGLNAELQEVECRMEEYPLSRAFLTLLTSLCGAAPLPRALGAGARAAGLDPYVDHVLTRLTLPAPHRTYAKPQEKWQVLSLCLGLLVKWLDSYEPSGADFPPARGGGGVSDVSPPPGLHVALRLHSGDELLRLIVLVLKEAQALLAVRGAQQVYIEECLVSSLQLLERALAIERALTQAAAEAGRSVLIVGLSKLILGASGSPEDCPLLAACRVLPHAATRPLAAAKAVALLVRATKNAAAARHILAASAATRVSAAEIRHGFVECLEAEEWSETAAEALKQAKEGVLTIIHQTLPNAAPNFAHFLLGYQLSEDVSRSQLNEPGAAGFPRTCLHSVLDLLDQHVASADHADRQASDLVESSYRLVYLLCARAGTSPPALRFLRSRDYFLSRHVKARVNLETASPATVSARSWVLRACACELGGAAGSRQHAALAALIRTLAPHSDRHAQEWEYCLLRQSLSALRISVEPAREPRWELLNAQLLRQAIASADIPTGLGGKRISVTRVHALLARELVALQATAAQRNLLADEIQKVLDYVTEINHRRNLAATVTHYYDSWRQLTEILFCVAPNDILDLEARKNLLLNILQDLLNKIPPAEVLPQIGNLASGTVLLLLVNLRHCYIIQKRDSNLKSQDFEASFFGPSNHIMQTKSLTLKFILHKILSWILVSGGSTQKMRVNLYGALLNYLNIVNLKTSTAESKDVTNINETYVSRLDSSKGPSTREESALKNMVVDVISEFGENLCSIVCGDCIGGGHDVCRMVALSCLDTLVEINPQTDWMHTLTNQGYLRSLIDSLLQDDEGLQQALETNPKTLRVLYVYESKMALLIKIAGTVMGAACVLAAGALSCLANMKALGCHPDVLAATETEAQPTRVHRFRQILIPALALCDALLTTLGTQNHSCVIHVTHFLLSHVECVDMVLRAAHPNSPNGLLIEVEAFTAVIARASNREVFGYVKQDTSLQQCAASSGRVQGLMLALIPRFANPPPQQEQDDSLLYHKIVSNLVTYARNILERDSSRVLFRPALLPADVSGSEGAGGGAPHCGAILDLLQSSVRRCHQQSKLLLTVSHQLQNVPTMTLEDMKKLLPPDNETSSPSEVRIALVSCLTRRASLRRRALQYCRHAAEGALYLAWAHLQVYHRASHAQLSDSFNTSLTPSSALRGAFGADLVELRKGLVGVFNERFAEQLLDIAKDQTPAQRCFLEVLLKDIKSMIQFSPL